MGSVSLVTAPAGSAAVGGLPVTINLASSATVGGQLIGTFGVQNTTGSPVTLNGFDITPSCVDPNNGPAPYCRLHADFGVLTVASAVGQDGTSCAGMPFVAGPKSIGGETFPLQTADDAGFVLAPDGACAVDVAFDVLKVPADADAAMDGVQTFLYSQPIQRGSFPQDFAIAEFTVVPGTSPTTIALHAPATGTLGAPIAATATVAGDPSGDSAPTGTVDFRLFGPTDGSCTGSSVATTQGAAVQVDGTAASEPFTPTVPGTYHWIAAYSGDTGHSPATTACGDAAAPTVVAKATTTLGLVAAPSVAPGGAISATATLAGGIAPGGEVVFHAWHDNLACEGPADFSSTVAVTKNGSYTSDAFAPTLVGTYRFTASYGGDATNSVVETTCDAPGTSVVVKAPDSIVPTITLDSGADTASLNPPGGTFRFHLTITNTSDKPVTTKSLNDSVYGDLAGRGTCKVGIVLAAKPGPGATYSCSYDGDFSGQSGASQKATVKASALDTSGNEATASHDTTVTIAAARVAAAVLANTPATPTAAGTGTGGSSVGVLARTGANFADQVRLGLGLLVAGLVLTRRRRSRAEPPTPVLTRPW